MRCYRPATRRLRARPVPRRSDPAEFHAFAEQGEQHFARERRTLLQHLGFRAAAVDDARAHIIALLDALKIERLLCRGAVEQDSRVQRDAAPQLRIYIEQSLDARPEQHDLGIVVE